ncbi:nose resistant to fluoxetine protein 6-like [Antedon mediterranea]|uniref:nose resistant to fluoxetine protein 6-like n=1 Tax=Antedon mediterranea TaxID=105859 RepID=UPI003AF6D11B
MVSTSKYCILNLLALISYCCAQFQNIGNQADAVNFIANQKSVNPNYQVSTKELQDVLQNVIVEPLLYPVDNHWVSEARGFDTHDETVFGMTGEDAGTNVTTEPMMVTNSTLEPTTLIVTEVVLEPTLCISDLATFAADILKKEKYAEMMVDSYGKPPPGILQGNILWLGLYDQCLSQSRTSNDNYDSFNGQYCLALVTNNTQLLFYVGICVPNSCNNRELTDLLNINSNSSIKVSVFCHKQFEYSTSAIACLALLVFLCAFALVGTIIEVFKNYKGSSANQNGFKKLLPDETFENTEHTQSASVNELIITVEENNSPGCLVKFLLCFSLLTNGRKILNTKQGEGSISCLNGIRVISLTWVILGHSYVFPFQLISNPVEIPNLLGRFTFQAVGNATFSVDSFFFLSGLLVTYLTLKYLQKNEGKINWVMFYVHRYLRLTPVYMIVIFVFATLTPHFASGPFYSMIFDPNPDPGVENQMTYCQDYWWTNLLYINNFYPTSINKECLLWGWYLANDMQFFIVSPFIIYLLYHYFYAGFTLWCVILLTCFSSLIGESIIRDISVNFSLDPNEVNFVSDLIYIRPWSRISTYLVGMALGYVLYKYRGRVRMSHYMVVLGWLAATGIALSVVYGLYGSYHGRPLSASATVVYITLCRFSWAVALAWVVFACDAGYGGPVNSLLSWSFWIPLSRINYCAYLVHPIIMFVFYYSLPNSIYFTDFLFVYFYLGHLMFSYAVAFLLSVCAEAPFMALEKLTLKRDKSV